MIVRNLFFAAILTLLLPFQLFAWGREGHQIVAQLAMRQLSDATRQKVLKLLGGISPEQAGTWMDDVRSNHDYDYMAPWHYTNIEGGENYSPAPKGDIITALNKAYADLQHVNDISPEDAEIDVLILFHLCGDLTQPLHVGFGLDKGGNNYQVQYNEKGTNLHHIWDTDIIESQGITLASLQDTSKAPATAAIQKLRTLKIDFMESLKESRSLLYAVYVFEGHKMDDTYMQKNKAIVEAQLRAAGNLLAACLEQLFYKVDKVPHGSFSIVKEPNHSESKALSVDAGTITAEQAAAHIGQTTTVCGKAYSAKFTGGSGVTFINMGGEYPNNPFTAVIMFKNRSSFSYKPEEYLNGKTICVTGTVIEYKGKPEIIVEKEDQIKVQ